MDTQIIENKYIESVLPVPSYRIPDSFVVSQLKLSEEEALRRSRERSFVTYSYRGEEYSVTVWFMPLSFAWPIHGEGFAVCIRFHIAVNYKEEEKENKKCDEHRCLSNTKIAKTTR